MEILLKYFPGLDPLQKDQYNRLKKRLIHWNRQINLVSRKDIEHLEERHILHSLGIALHARFAPGDRVLDVGTGGGFPGLPLAIMFPDACFTLIDSIGKKVRAVDAISRDLDLRNVRCLKIRAEDYPDKVQHVVSRAVTGLDRFTGWVKKNLVDPEGEAVPEEKKTYGPGTGIWYLKGGDIENEIKSYPHARVFNLGDVFSESFFESKKLVWLPPESLP